MEGLKQRAKTLIDLAEMAQFYVHPLQPDEKAQASINAHFKELVQKIVDVLDGETSFDHGHLEQLFRDLAEKWSLKLGELAQVLRIAITGRTISPSMFEVMEVLGKDEVIGRLASFK
jgi:glutamyl-tRNA synthetase